MIKEYLLLAGRNFTRRKLRSWLTVLGIVIGIAAVVALISVTLGLQYSITEQFQKLGTNKLIIMPGGEGGMMAARFSTAKLTEKDLSAIEKTKGVDTATVMIYAYASVKFRDETKQALVIGLPTDESSRIITEMQGFTAEKGRNLKSSDKDKVTIGNLISKDSKNNGLFEKGVSLRDTLTINGQNFDVVGIIKSIGNPQDDKQIYIPLDTAKDLLNKTDEFDMIYVQTKDGFKPADVAENVKKELRDFRNEKKGEETFSVQTFEQLLASVGTILTIIRIVLLGIAGISLIVGGIGIMNSMYTSVLERTREIGIMKAVGAKNENIMNLFILESGLYGLIGGAIGAAIGVIFAKTVETIAKPLLGVSAFHVAFPWWLIAGALGFSLVIGAISGYMPARRASKLRPVEALRYE